MTSPNRWQIFVLGTNNWQGGGEFAPGSGILHEGHHKSLNAIDGVSCYSMWPSKVQRTDPERKDYRVFALKHDIPICESVSPVSSYRWHRMPDEEFDAYRARLLAEVEDFIATVEKDSGREFNLFMAHHTFVNPTVLAEVNKRRVANGKARVPLVVFAHGTALKMYQHELKGSPDFTNRFLPWMRETMKVFDSSAGHVDGVYAIAEAQRQLFGELFPEFDAKRVAVVPNGYNQLVFYPRPPVKAAALPPVFAPEGLTIPDDVKAALGFDADGKPPATWMSPGGISASKADIKTRDRVIVFTGKFADWKRLDVVLKAAQTYTPLLEKNLSTPEQPQRVVTLVCGTGPDEDRLHYHKLAYEELKLTRTYFLGPQPQDVLAEINTLADVGVFPSKDEPFGLVFIECMACQTPVVGARSGGPVDFVTSDVGVLLEESEDNAVLAQRLADTVCAAVADDWKAKMGPTCLDYATKNFSLRAQCERMLGAMSESFLVPTAATSKAPSSAL